MELSVVIPVLNEEDNVGALHAEVKEVCEAAGYTYEILFVDDGSTDATFARIRELSPVRCLRLRRNFGQTAAMDAGIKAARYGLIVTMDGDRQNDPHDIPALLEHLQAEGLDVVSGWRKNRVDPLLKRFISRGANLLRKALVRDSIHDSGCSLKVYRAECFATLSLFGEMHRFIPALLKIRGFSVGELVVNHRARIAGRTKYNMTRTIKGFIDMVSVWFWHKYAVRPLHLLGALGLLLLGCGGMAALMTIWDYLHGIDLSDTVWPLLAAFLLIMGVQVFISGLLADIVVKSYYETTRDSPYHIAQTIANE